MSSNNDFSPSSCSNFFYVRVFSFSSRAIIRKVFIPIMTRYHHEKRACLDVSSHSIITCREQPFPRKHRSCGKTFMRVHPFYLGLKKDGLDESVSSRVVRHFSSVCKRASIQHWNILHKVCGTRYVIRSRDVVTMKIDPHGYMHFLGVWCSALRAFGPQRSCAIT